jgi:hypothetical protein
LRRRGRRRQPKKRVVSRGSQREPQAHSAFNEIARAGRVRQKGQGGMGGTGGGPVGLSRLDPPVIPIYSSQILSYPRRANRNSGKYSKIPTKQKLKSVAAALGGAETTLYQKNYLRRGRGRAGGEFGARGAGAA